jgi:post-segregation antitoxin (ccd killing protein)
MARMNVYLPDELADELRAAGLNLSSVTRAAVVRELALRRTDAWLRRVTLERQTEVLHRTALGALRAVDTDP